MISVIYEGNSTKKDIQKNFMKIQKSNADFNDKSIILFFHEKSKFDKFETTSRRQSCKTLVLATSNNQMFIKNRSTFFLALD